MVRPLAWPLMRARLDAATNHRSNIRPSYSRRLGGAADRPAAVDAATNHRSNTRPSYSRRLGGAADRPAAVDVVRDAPLRSRRTTALKDQRNRAPLTTFVSLTRARGARPDRERPLAAGAQ